MTTKGFYDSPEWLAVRYEALKVSRGHCVCCGDRASPENPLHVDHIKPRSRHPTRAERHAAQDLLAVIEKYARSAFEECTKVEG